MKIGSVLLLKNVAESTISGGDDDGDDDDSSAAGGQKLNGFAPNSNGRADPRSVSSSLHDRPKSSNTPNNANVNGAGAATGGSTSAHHQHRQTPIPTSTRHKNRSSSHSAGAGAGDTSGSPQNTKETFLNYFFGGGGAGAGPNMLAGAAGAGAQPAALFGTRAGKDSVGKDFITQDNGRESMPSGSPFGSSSSGRMDTNSTAYDMKSLSKHIEAVRKVGTTDDSFL